jgi:plasmid stabilization system protein ParE
LIWSQTALKDTQRLYRFLASKHQPSAQKAMTAIRSSVEKLRQFPQLGKPIDGLPIEFREWQIEFGHRGYCVCYRFDDQQVLIVSIKHQLENH